MDQIKLVKDHFFSRAPNECIDECIHNGVKAIRLPFFGASGNVCHAECSREELIEERLRRAVYAEDYETAAKLKALKESQP